MLERSNRSHSAICTGDEIGRHTGLYAPGPERECRFKSCPVQHTPLAQTEEHLTFNQGIMGSIPIRRTMLGVAQLAEHRVVAPAADGSNPFPQPMES